MSSPVLEHPTSLRREEQPPLLVSAHSVTREFGSRVVLQGVSLDIAPGEIHALLGPNGAGKTTLLRILAGLLARSGGDLRVAGVDPSHGARDFRRLIGLVPPTDRSFYMRISGLENLVFFGRLHGLRRRAARARALDLLAKVGLDDAAGLRVASYSQGMQKRLAVARALLTDPRVLLVDEATHDLDPMGASAVRRLVRELAEHGTAVLWATQRLDEIVGFADRVTLLRDGVCGFSGPVHDFAGLAGSRRYVVRLRRGDGSRLRESDAAEAIGAAGAIARTRDGSHEYFLLDVADGVALGDALARLAAADAELLSCERERSQVEEAFLLLTESADR